MTSSVDRTIALAPATELWPRWHTTKNSTGNKTNYEQFFGQKYDVLCDAMRKIVIEVGCHWPKVKSFRAKASQDLRKLAITTLKHKYSGLVSGGPARQHVRFSRPTTFEEDVDKALADLITKMFQNDTAGVRRAAAAGVLDYQDKGLKTKSNSLRRPAGPLPTYNEDHEEENEIRPAEVSELLNATAEEEYITITRTNGERKTQFKTKVTRKREGDSIAVSKTITSPLLPAISSIPQTISGSATESEPPSTSSSVYTRSKANQLSSPIRLVSKRKALPPLMIPGQLALPSFNQLALPQPSGQGQLYPSHHPPTMVWPVLRSQGRGQLGSTEDRLGQYHAGLAMSHLTSAHTVMLPPTTGNPSFFAPAPRSPPLVGTTSYSHTTKLLMNPHPAPLQALPAKTSFLCPDTKATLLLRCHNFTWILNDVDASRRSPFLAALIAEAPPPPPFGLKTVDLSFDTVPNIDAILQHAWNGKYEISFFVQLPELHLDVLQAASRYGIADLATQACENCINIIDRMPVRNDVASLIGRVLNMYTSSPSEAVYVILQALAEHCAKSYARYHQNTGFMNVSIVRGSLFASMVMGALESMERRHVKAQQTRSRVEKWTEGVI